MVAIFYGGSFFIEAIFIDIFYGGDFYLRFFIEAIFMADFLWR